MGIQDDLAFCEECADAVEVEMPEFASVTREAVELIRSWGD